MSFRRLVFRRVVVQRVHSLSKWPSLYENDFRSKIGNILTRLVQNFKFTKIILKTRITEKRDGESFSKLLITPSDSEHHGTT